MRRRRLTLGRPTAQRVRARRLDAPPSHLLPGGQYLPFCLPQLRRVLVLSFSPPPQGVPVPTESTMEAAVDVAVAEKLDPSRR